jgi:hypothetical protein
MGSEMWVTEIHHKNTGKLIHRAEHGPSYNKAMDAHNYYLFNYATHRIHLIWEE